jgi:heat-inducible transcriptional repressor
MVELSGRKSTILRAVVVEYVAVAEPVASDHIVSKYDLGVRGATVRHELAEIADLGFLEQPHTSAGRVPSDKGYRYYVDHLMVVRPPGEATRIKVQTATEEQDTLAELLRDVTKSLSRITRLLSVAATVKNADVPVKSVVLAAVGPGKTLLVVVLQNGQVENRIVESPPGTTLEHIGQANEALGALAGMSVRKASRAKTPVVDDPVLAKLLRSAFAVFRATAREITRGHVFLEGEEYVIAEPEFRTDPAAMTSLIESMEDEETLHETVLGEGITIGSENPAPRMRGLGIVRRQFFAGEHEAGSLAIIGPKRLRYPEAVSLLDFTSKAVSQALSRLAE